MCVSSDPLVSQSAHLELVHLTNVKSSEGLVTALCVLGGRIRNPHIRWNFLFSAPFAILFLVLKMVLQQRPKLSKTFLNNSASEDSAAHSSCRSQGPSWFFFSSPSSCSCVIDSACCVRTWRLSFTLPVGLLHSFTSPVSSKGMYIKSTYDGLHVITGTTEGVSRPQLGLDWSEISLICDAVDRY